MVYPRIFGQNKRFKRECLQIPSNVGKALSLKWKKKIRHIKMIRNKMRFLSINLMGCTSCRENSLIDKDG